MPNKNEPITATIVLTQQNGVITVTSSYTGKLSADNEAHALFASILCLMAIDRVALFNLLKRLVKQEANQLMADKILNLLTDPNADIVRGFDNTNFH